MAILQVIGSTVINTGFNLGSGWQHLALVRKGGAVSLYANSRLVASAAAADSVGDTDHVLRLGTGVVYKSAAWSGQLALWRLGASVPSPDQIQKIYRDEKRLFEENAACTLFGSSDAVVDLVHDEITDLLHVGTSGGRSDFTGLQRVSHNATAVAAAITAHDGLIIQE